MDQMTAIKARKRWFDRLRTIDKLRTEYAFAADDIAFLLVEIDRRDKTIGDLEGASLALNVDASR